MREAVTRERGLVGTAVPGRQSRPRAKPPAEAEGNETEEKARLVAKVPPCQDEEGQ